MKKPIPTALKVAHLSIMGILMALNLIMAIINSMDGIFVQVFLNVFNMIALACGFIYVSRNYEKAAAKWYKAFILVTTIPNIIIAVYSFSERGPGPYLALLVVKIALLVVIAFWKDLGKNDTWYMFAALFVLDIIFIFVFGKGEDVEQFRIIAVASKLVLTGTIGLAIAGKYADKAARGRE